MVSSPSRLTEWPIFREMFSFRGKLPCFICGKFTLGRQYKQGVEKPICFECQFGPK